MFENGSLLRRRKRFKLHKPDKELLKSELQALASAMPPPARIEHSNNTLSSAGSVQTSSLNEANLHRLREDLLRWELQEQRRMMFGAGSSSSTSNFGFSDATMAAAAAAAAVAAAGIRSEWSNSHVLHENCSNAATNSELSSASNPYETALLHSSPWNLSNNLVSMGSPYVPRLGIIAPVAVSSDVLKPEIEVESRLTGHENFNRFSRSSFYSSTDCPKNYAKEHAVSIANSTSSQSPITHSAETSNFVPDSVINGSDGSLHDSPSSTNLDLQSITNLRSGDSAVGKKTKKPFTIENIIAPDDNESSSAKQNDDEYSDRSSALLVPKSLYVSSYPLTNTSVLSTSKVARSSYRATIT